MILYFKQKKGIMIFNAALFDPITELDRELWLRVIDTICDVSTYYNRLDKKQKFIVECHSICRALASHIPELRMVDGGFLGLVLKEKDGQMGYSINRAAHSWLVTPDGAIIDPYPVGFNSLSPILIVPAGEYTPYGKNLYEPTSTSNCAPYYKKDRKHFRKSTVLLRYMREARSLKVAA